MARDPIGDQDKTWLKPPLGAKQPTNFSRIALFNNGKGLVLGERGSLLRWVDYLDELTTLCNQAPRAIPGETLLRSGIEKLNARYS